MVEFTRDVGRKWKIGHVVNLPTSTLKAMAKSDGVDSFSDFSEVLARGERCIPFMKERRKNDQIAGSVLRRNKAAPLKTGAAPAKRKRGRPKRTATKK